MNAAELGVLARVLVAIAPTIEALVSWILGTGPKPAIVDALASAERSRLALERREARIAAASRPVPK